MIVVNEISVLPSYDDWIDAVKRARKFFEQTEEESHWVFCRGLAGYDLSDSEQVEEARKARVFDEKCPLFVRRAVEIIFELDKVEG